MKVLLITCTLLFAHFCSQAQNNVSKNITLNTQPVTVIVEKQDLSYKVSICFLSPKINISTTDSTIHFKRNPKNCTISFEFVNEITKLSELNALFKDLNQQSKVVFNSRNLTLNTDKISIDPYSLIEFNMDSLKFKINIIKTSLEKGFVVFEDCCEIKKDTTNFYTLTGNYGSKQLQNITLADSNLLFSTIVVLMKESKSPLTEKEKELTKKIADLEESINKRDTAGVFTFKPTFEGNNAYYKIRNKKYFERIEARNKSKYIIDAINPKVTNLISEAEKALGQNTDTAKSKLDSINTFVKHTTDTLNSLISNQSVKICNKNYARQYSLKTKNFQIDSLEIKIEDQCIQQILLFANSCDKSYIFKNRRSIPIRSVPYLIKYPRTRMVGFSYDEAQKDKSFYYNHNRTLLKKIGYEVPIGNILTFVPSLQNNTFNISPQDTILHINPKNISRTTTVFRSNLQDYLRINLFSDFLAIIGREQNPVINSEINLKIPFWTNYFPTTPRASISFFNCLGGNLVLSQFSNTFEGLMLRNKHETNSFDSILKDNIKTVSTIDLYRYAFLKSAFVVNLATLNSEAVSADAYLNIFSEYGSTSITDSIFSDTTSGVPSNTLTLNSKNYNFANFGLEIGFKSTPLTNFRYTGYFKIFHPILSDNNITQDYGTSYSNPENKLIIPINGVNDLGTFLRKSLFSTGITLSYYPNREKLNLFYFRFQYTGYLHNWRMNSYPILQFGYSISLSKFLSTLKK